MDASRPGQWTKCISTHGNIRGVAIEATALVREMARVHGLQGIHAQGLGESVIGALLIASYCKAGQRINLNIQGDGHFSQALVDAYPDGKVRGYVIGRETSGASSEFGPWGEGVLSVLRTKNVPGEAPYIGSVPLLTGHLAKDLTFYWMQSEQIPSSVGLVVKTQGAQVEAAGGFLVQALPGATDAEIKAIDRHIQEIQAFAEQVTQGSNPMGLLSQIFQDTAFIVLEERPLEFHCDCSWARVERALMLVGPAELKAMLAQDHEATVLCDFCAKKYTVDAAQLQALIDRTSQPEG